MTYKKLIGDLAYIQSKQLSGTEIGNKYQTVHNQLSAWRNKDEIIYFFEHCFGAFDVGPRVKFEFVSIDCRQRWFDIIHLYEAKKKELRTMHYKIYVLRVIQTSAHSQDSTSFTTCI